MCRQKAPQSVQQAPLGHLYLHQTEKTGDHLITILVALHNDCQHEIRWLPDSGADVDALSAQDFHRLDSNLQHHLAPGQLVCAANGGELDSLGTLSATLALNGRSCHTTLHIYPQLSTSLLSKATSHPAGSARGRLAAFTPCRGSGLKRGTATSSRSIAISHGCGSGRLCIEELYHGRVPIGVPRRPLRSMAGPPMHITLRSDAVPCRHYRARAILFQWRNAVEGQLSSMESKGVIKKVPVGEPFTWCHPMVVVPKKASAETRDLTGLSKYIERPAYPTRVPSEVVARIPSGMRYFTTLDSRHGYWQIPLDAESSKLTTFITPWGAYRFRRNVMGLISAGDEHNRRGDEALAGLDNVQKVVEDVIIYDTDLDTHVHRVREVIRRCSEHGITPPPPPIPANSSLGRNLQATAASKSLQTATGLTTTSSKLSAPSQSQLIAQTFAPSVVLSNSFRLSHRT